MPIKVWGVHHATFNYDTGERLSELKSLRDKWKQEQVERLGVEHVQGGQPTERFNPTTRYFKALELHAKRKGITVVPLADDAATWEIIKLSNLLMTAAELERRHGTPWAVNLAFLQRGISPQSMPKPELVHAVNEEFRRHGYEFPWVLFLGISKEHSNENPIKHGNCWHVSWPSICCLMCLTLRFTRARRAYA